jgi:hypothetical protein
MVPDESSINPGWDTQPPTGSGTALREGLETVAEPADVSFSFGNADLSAKVECLRLRGLLSSEGHGNLGTLDPVTGVQTTLRMGRVAAHPIQYPTVVLDALCELFTEYNKHFEALVEANREFSTDYRFARDTHGRLANSFVQIDMLGLPPAFLTNLAGVDKRLVKDVLRHTIFEIENSLAMYQLLERMFVRDSGPSLFAIQFRRSLDDLRDQHGRPIVLLAVTDGKFEAMREGEFGKRAGEQLASSEVRELSGFDDLWGPEDFKRHIAENRGQCGPLLYVRSSDPVSKLKNPHELVRNDLLGDSELRRIIKANALTFNIDSPAQVGAARINDTKAYLAPMGMAFAVRQPSDLGIPRDGLTPECARYLQAQGIDPARVTSGECLLRAKPLRGTYGGYGHIRGPLNEKLLRELGKEITKRGEYVVQPELVTPTIVNAGDGRAYTYMDRNFLSCVGGAIRFLGGVRICMPTDSMEARKGRIHGSHESVYQQIY